MNPYAPRPARGLADRIISTARGALSSVGALGVLGALRAWGVLRALGARGVLLALGASGVLRALRARGARSARALARLLLAGGCAAAPLAMAQTVPMGTLFGIRLGEVLQQQCPECPRDASGAYATGFHTAEQPCWLKEGYSLAIKLPQSAVQEMGHALGSTAQVTTHEGRVVQVEAYGDPQAWRAVERHLMRRHGQPTASETYGRDSRVFGLSTERSHTWRDARSALYFVSRSGSDHVRVRLVDLAWEKAAAAEREERRARRAARGGF